MARNTVWHDDYWLLLMQIYLRKPVGVKPLYSREMVDLGLELHIAPQALMAKMQQIARLDTPRIERIWRTYSGKPRKLERAASLLRSMNGFGAADEFYDGVEVQETFEKEFRPLVPTAHGAQPEKLEERLTPVMLILILNLYFQLTPATMVSNTPEVQQTARMLKLTPDEVVQVLDTYQACDPYLNRGMMMLSPLLLHCQQVWQRFGNHEPTELEGYAEQLREYFK
ncbi:MAG: hypothetical protein K5928_09385 [Prevotella sp.]|nr:hypothetical protein [Prevotella sp.]